MPRAHPPLRLWLPPLARVAADHPLRTLLPRADRLGDAAVGQLNGLDGYFDRDPSGPLPAAALVRDWLAADAGDAMWLSADPAWVQPDINGVRLMACGQLQLDETEAGQVAEVLAPALADAGLQLELTTPDRWHLRLPPGTALPVFAPPEQALGEDLLAHLPQGPEGRRWRTLLNEAQILLHQHPLQVRRQARGLAPVNSLWLWGGGTRPRQVSSTLAGVVGDDPLLQALAARAGIGHRRLTPEHVAAAAAGWLVDLHDQSQASFDQPWWPCLAALLRRQPALLHFASGEQWLSRPWHRWRRWRKVAE